MAKSDGLYVVVDYCVLDTPALLETFANHDLGISANATRFGIDHLSCF